MDYAIGTSPSIMSARRYLDQAAKDISSSYEKLTSGQRINRSADDSAGLSISERLRTQNLGYQQAQRNIQDGLSLVQVMDGGLNTIRDILQRLRVLALQAASDTITDADRVMIETERIQLTEEIDRSAGATEYNGIELLRCNGGGGAGDPVGSLLDAITALDSGNQIVNFRVSFIRQSTSTDGDQTVNLADQNDNNPNNAQFQADVLAAFNEWGNLLENIYSAANGAPANLTVNFINLGVEAPGATTVGSNASEGYYDLPQNNIGDFRVGMHTFDGQYGTLAHAYYPVSGDEVGSVGSVGGDIHFDRQENYRIEGAAPSGSDFSVKLLTAHEIGHSLGLGHTTNTANVMYPMLNQADDFSDRFPAGFTTGGLEASMLEAVYGAPGSPATPDEETSTGFGPTSVTLQIGPNKEDTMKFDLLSVDSTSLGVDEASFLSRESAENAIDSIDSAIETIGTDSARVGAVMNRLQSTQVFSGIANENISQAESQIRDADISVEIVELTTKQMIMNVGISMLAQANANSRYVLQLL